MYWRPPVWESLDCMFVYNNITNYTATILCNGDPRKLLVTFKDNRKSSLSPLLNIYLITARYAHKLHQWLYSLTARWAAKAILSGLRAHTLRLCTLTTPSMLMNVSKTSEKFTPFGMPSINTTIVSRSMLNVVTNTNKENMNVHIGSTIFQSGWKIK